MVNNDSGIAHCEPHSTSIPFMLCVNARHMSQRIFMQDSPLVITDMHFWAWNELATVRSGQMLDQWTARFITTSTTTSHQINNLHSYLQFEFSSINLRKIFSSSFNPRSYILPQPHKILILIIKMNVSPPIYMFPSIHRSTSGSTHTCIKKLIFPWPFHYIWSILTCNLWKRGIYLNLVYFTWTLLQINDNFLDLWHFLLDLSLCLTFGILCLTFEINDNLIKQSPTLSLMAILMLPL